MALITGPKDWEAERRLLDYQLELERMPMDTRRAGKRLSRQRRWDVGDLKRSRSQAAQQAQWSQRDTIRASNRFLKDNAVQKKILRDQRARDRVDLKYQLHSRGARQSGIGVEARRRQNYDYGTQFKQIARERKRNRIDRRTDLKRGAAQAEWQTGDLTRAILRRRKQFRWDRSDLRRDLARNTGEIYRKKALVY
jgi:hypothetical protein